MNTYPIGVIGCGYIAKKIYFPLLSTMPELRVIKVLSQTKANWDEIHHHWPELLLTTSWNEWIGSGIKAALVLTPAETHYEICDRLLDAGIHTLVEKPPTTSTTKTLTLAQKAQKMELVFMVGFNRRYSPPVTKSLELFREKPIRLFLAEKYRPSQQKRALAETYQEDLIHQIDLMRSFCGFLTPLQTSAVEEKGTLLSSISTLRSNSGGLSVMLHSRESGLWQERVTIIGDELTLRLELFRTLEKIDAEGKEILWKSGTAEQEYADRGFLAEVRHFIKCIRNQTQPITNGFEAAKTQDLQESLAALQTHH